VNAKFRIGRKGDDLLNELWNQVCDITVSRRVGEFTCEHAGMKLTAEKLKGITFYFVSEEKFWYQLNCLLRSKIQNNTLTPRCITREN